jgi:hypothetical protein
MANIAAVAFHRTIVNVEFVRYLSGGFPYCDHAQDPALGGCQIGGRRSALFECFFAIPAVEQSTRQTGTDERPSSGYGSYSIDDIHDGTFFYDVAGTSQVQGAVQKISLAVNCQKYDLRRQIALPHLAGHGKTVQLPHVEIEKCNLRLEFLDQLESSFSIARFAYHLEIGFFLDDLAQSFPYDRVIVH